MEVEKSEFEKYVSYLSETDNNAKILRRLRASQDAVAFTQGKLVHGPGNVTDAFEESKGKNMSAARVAREGESGGYLFESDIKRSAIAARRAQGGNCDEHGKVAYYRLVHQADKNDWAYLCSNGWHVFAILADPPGSLGQYFSSLGSFDESTAVVVDAWLRPSFAVKFNHWRFKDTKYKIEQSSQCHGGAAEGNLLKAVRANDSKPERTKKKLTMRAKVEEQAPELYKTKPGLDRTYPRWPVSTDELHLRLLRRDEEASGITPSSSNVTSPSFLHTTSEWESRIFDRWRT